MTGTNNGNALSALAPLLGEWRLTAVFKDIPPADVDARVSFEWLPGERFMIERWDSQFPRRPTGSRSSVPIRSATASTFSTTSTRAASLACTR